MTKNCQTLLLCFCVLLFPLHETKAQITQQHETLESRMGENTFKKSGLNKLSKEELLFLNRWLLENAHVTQTSPPLPPAQTSNSHHPENRDQTVNDALANITREQAKAVLNRSLSRTIKGEFQGWSGKTVFKMNNGEIWQQRLSGKYYKKLDSPGVIIRKNEVGFYQMEILATGRKVGVKRIR